jgi:hypothetical protein
LNLILGVFEKGWYNQRVRPRDARTSGTEEIIEMSDNLNTDSTDRLDLLAAFQGRQVTVYFNTSNVCQGNLRNLKFHLEGSRVSLRLPNGEEGFFTDASLWDTHSVDPKDDAIRLDGKDDDGTPRHVEIVPLA